MRDGKKTFPLRKAKRQKRVDMNIAYYWAKGRGY
jgi:hypothetical protein